MKVSDSSNARYSKSNIVELSTVASTAAVFGTAATLAAMTTLPGQVVVAGISVYHLTKLSVDNKDKISGGITATKRFFTSFKRVK